jgi:hypothetical protein
MEYESVAPHYRHERHRNEHGQRSINEWRQKKNSALLHAANPLTSAQISSSVANAAIAKADGA